MAHAKRAMPELSSGAMADIAFLMLTFYMVTTEIKEYKGLSIMLPEFKEQPIVVARNDRNIFAIRVNARDQIMIEGEERITLYGLREEIGKFVMNNKADPTLSDNPRDAIVSIKTDRGSTYKAFISILDEVQAGYYEIYGERAGLSAEEFRRLDLTVPSNKKIYEQARDRIPMNISIAEP